MRTVLLLLAAAAAAGAQDSDAALDRYIEDSLALRNRAPLSSGSLFQENGYLAELARDPRASQAGDLITVLVAERASALTRGALSQSRDSESDSSVSRLLGVLGPGAALPNLLNQNSNYGLQGSGSTSRETNVTAVITAHVSHVMPNGNLVIEGVKEVAVNAERQLVWLRGVVRQADLRPDNSVRSEQVAMLELKIDGKGVVNSAIKRPNILYRIFRDILPF